jgi:hypothetical protein
MLLLHYWHNVVAYLYTIDTRRIQRATPRGGTRVGLWWRAKKTPRGGTRVGLWWRAKKQLTSGDETSNPDSSTNPLKPVKPNDPTKHQTLSTYSSYSSYSLS